MDLIIVESPTKARTLSRFLGNKYELEATMGHIKDLPKSKISVDVDNNFKPDYKILVKKKEIIKKLKIMAQKSKKIYLATDPDREGEAIAFHTKEVISKEIEPKIKSNNFYRIVFHEITKEAVEEAINNPRNIDINLVDAQTARRVLDRLVGYKLSPLLWKKIRRGLSAGRVQSVAVRLIVEREREIEAFVPEEYWEIYCKVKKQESKVGKEEFIIKLIKINDKKFEVKNGVEAGKIVNELEGSEYKVLDVRMREIKKSPYPPFTTSTMTQTAARFYGWSAKKTMSIAQHLYEEGLITYHRTDSTNISKIAINQVRDYINNRFGKNYLSDIPRIYKTTSKVAQEAHEAIRPTQVKLSDNDLNIENQKFDREGKILYSLIWKRFVASQMANCLFDETVIDVAANPKQQSSSTYILRAVGQVMKFDGWRRVIPLSKDEEPELPLVQKYEKLSLIQVLSDQKFTQPPARYNEASLIKTLESLGIGRPSTYAPIITTIQLRNYVEKKEGKFYPTQVGIAVSDFLVKSFSDIVDYSFTAEMENELDEIANGKEKWISMMKKFYPPFEKKLKIVEKKSKRVKIEVEKLGENCPKCSKGELVVRIGRFGKFVSCSRFPDCDYTGKYVEKINMKCPKCKDGDVVVKSTKKGKRFYGCSRYPDCKWASWRKPTLSEIQTK